MSLKSNYRDGDTYTKKSKKEGYRSRASYKLKEILEKDIKILKGQSVNRVSQDLNLNPALDISELGSSKGFLNSSIVR